MSPILSSFVLIVVVVPDTVRSPPTITSPVVVISSVVILVSDPPESLASTLASV